MTIVILLTAVLVAVGWLCLSPVRLAGVGAVLLVTHPMLMFALTALAMLALTAYAARIIYRSLRAGGWHLLTVERPAFAISKAGGMAP
ncbi:hypothetical protein [Actinomadura oligospora]|uniref:hypothetical protein n=1 Tax=Actinomadura oligospora TaxID=111804 RepID=UPI00047A58F5|nr:hypothetical protein [Actinomadura oligospora]